MVLQETNRFSEAEPLMRRALEIMEKSFGQDHPKVAVQLNKLARLLQSTNRLTEAAPLMRRHVAIFVAFTRATGHEHPHLKKAFTNYSNLLEELGKSQVEIESEIEKLIQGEG